jgi:hypothetical protein
VQDEFALTTSLLIRWGPGEPSTDLVSFYSLEYAGKVGLNSKVPHPPLLPRLTSRQGDRRYTEIFRDPPEADINSVFELRHWFDDLEPGCSYAFRLRGINGFGPGPFTYRIFNTRSALLPPPRIMSVTHDSVSLRWIFSSTFLHQLQQLKKIFALADKDGSGVISREELIATFVDQSDTTLTELMKMIRKVLIKKGVNPDRVSLLFTSLPSLP